VIAKNSLGVIVRYFRTRAFIATTIGKPHARYAFTLAHEPSPAAFKRAGKLIAMILTDMAYEKAEREARAEKEGLNRTEAPDGSDR